MDEQIKLNLNDFGFYLGTDIDQFELRRHRKLVQKAAIRDVREIRISEGCYTSSTALMRAIRNNAKIIFQTINGCPVAILTSVDFTGGETRIKQYEALKNEKGLIIANALIASKLKSCNQVLSLLRERQLELKPPNITDLQRQRMRFLGFESGASKGYFSGLRKHFPKWMKFKDRRKNAYDVGNNTLSFGYFWLEGEVLMHVLNCGLDPALGVIHTPDTDRKHSLVYDLVEPYRSLIDIVTVRYFNNGFDKNCVKTEWINGEPRKLLAYPESNRYLKVLDAVFESTVEAQRITKFGSKSKIRTIISEDIQRLGLFLRGKHETWSPTQILDYIEPSTLLN